MVVENNEVRILGIRPAHNTSDFPVSQADKDLLKMTIHLMAYHQPTTAWKKVLCDLNGKLIVDPTAILENPPVEDNAGKAATSEWCYDHWKDVSAHHAKYTNGEAQTVADARILIHKNIATAHQNAPQLILDHKGDASAHHAKYTDAEARIVHSPISIPPSAFIPYFDTFDHAVSPTNLKNRATLNRQYFIAPVIFPHGVTVTKLTLYAYCNDGLATLYITLDRNNRIGASVRMAIAGVNWTDGYGERYDDSIDQPIIDNSLYDYSITIDHTPNDSVNDVFFTGAKIEFTG